MRALSEAMTRHGIPGLNLAWSDSSAALQRLPLGLADRENSLAMGGHHRMPAGSVGKTFTAATALTVLAAHHIDPDQSIERWFAEESWYLGWLPAAAGISARMLLNHTSGIPDHRASQGFSDKLKAHLLQDPPDYQLYFAPRELIACVAQQPLDFLPGSQFRYSETGYIVCGLLIEKIAGESYYPLVEKLFLQPLALRETVPAVAGPIPALAQGYCGANAVGLPQRTLAGGELIVNPATEWSGGGFVSSAADLARWARSLYGGDALSPACLQAMLTIAPAAGRANYSLGCYHWDTPFGKCYGHSGETPGYRSIMAYAPALDLALALQINTSIPRHEVLRELLHCALRDIL